MSSLYSLSVRRAQGIQWNPGPLHGGKPSLYVKIYLDGEQIGQTKTVKKTLAPEWHEDLPISSEKPTAPLLLILLHDASVLKDPCVGSVTIPLDELLKKCAADTESQTASLQLVGDKGGSKGKPVGSLLVHMKEVTPTKVRTVIAEMQTNVADHDLGLSSTADGFASGLATVLAKLDCIVNVGDQLSTISPYAQAAWNILTALYKAVQEQQDIDKKVAKLVQTMVEVYSFVEDVESLPQKIMRLESVVTEITKQTLECAIFIREYTGHGFGGRLIRSTWLDPAQKIDELSNALVMLKDLFDRGLAIHSVFVSAKIRDAVETLVQSDQLKVLNPLNLDASLRSECLPGTRKDVLQQITDWLTTPSKESNILWLHAVAGAGKSTISTTVSQYFRKLHRLGAFLFFDRNNSAGSNPAKLICTIAHSLAIFNPHIKEAVCQAIADDPSIATAPMSTQVEQLLLKPLAAAQHQILGPIIVILDALDECGNPGSRESLVSMITEEFPKLPAVFRFLITSRAESDLDSQFRGHPQITELQLNIGTQATKHDIVVYLHHAMQKIRKDQKLQPDWPGEQNIQDLADHSGGLFIWAATACKFIRGFQPPKRLEIVLLTGVANNLDELYTAAIQNSADWTDAIFAETAHAVLGAVVLSRVPLNDQAIDKLLHFEPGTAADVLKHLLCVIQWSQGQSALVLHASFTDYLTDEHRSGGHVWFVNSQVLSRCLSMGCMHILKSQLKFNICKLENSHILNVDIPDLPDRIKAHIPTELKYAALFWPHHLSDTVIDNEIFAELKTFMNNQFLYWLEVLSLLNELPVAIQSLQSLQNYITGTDQSFQDLVQDALRFLLGFAPVIIQSAPHIYISALPFAPRESLICKQFASFLQQTLHSMGPIGASWPNLSKVFLGHSSSVQSIAFSPNGKQIVSGSWDNTVRVWDSGTGSEVILIKTNYVVHSVAWSPDGKTIMSAGHGVELWDSQTGALIRGPFGHDIRVHSAAFSPDGKWIATTASLVAHNRTVQLWDVSTLTVVGLFKGHTGSVQSVVFSPDGKQVASGSADFTICVWNCETRSLAAGPFHCKGSVTSIAFSPDGRQIACGTGTQVLDSTTGAVVSGEITGERFTSVAFSPDGCRLARGSSINNKVQIQDSQTGEVLSVFNYVDVQAVVFSPDGKHILSASDDHTIQIWDATMVSPNMEILPVHTKNITSVAFSPDGDLIVSASQEGAVELWDSRTMALVAGPLKHSRAIWSVSFSPDGKQIALGGHGGKLQVWEYSTGNVIESFLEANIWSVAFSPDGHHVAVGSSDQTIKVVKSGTGDRSPRLFKGHTERVTSVAFSPDGQQLASGSSDLTVRIWDFGTGAQIVEQRSGHFATIVQVAFSPNGQTLASVGMDETIRIWDSETGVAVSQLVGHNGWFTSIAFSPDGSLITSGSDDKTVQVWDVKAGTIIAGPFEGHSGQINSVAFSPDGKRIASGSRDASIRVWEVEPLSYWGNHPRFTDGWLINSSLEHVLWVPPWLRESLYLPWNSLVIYSRGTTKLDLHQFVHGTNWHKCIEKSAHNDAKENDLVH